MGAECFHTLSDQERHLEKAEWDEIRFGQVCTPASSLANWKAAILKLCDDTGRCDWEVVEKIVSFGERLDRLSTTVLP